MVGDSDILKMETKKNKNIKAKRIFLIIVFGLLLAGAAYYIIPRHNSIMDGGPRFPEGCKIGYPSNVTATGQVVSSYFWNNKCCSKAPGTGLGDGHYYKICWDKIK